MALRLGRRIGSSPTRTVLGSRSVFLDVPGRRAFHDERDAADDVIACMLGRLGGKPPGRAVPPGSDPYAFP